MHFIAFRQRYRLYVAGFARAAPQKFPFLCCSGLDFPYADMQPKGDTLAKVCNARLIRLGWCAKQVRHPQWPLIINPNGVQTSCCLPVMLLCFKSDLPGLQMSLLFHSWQTHRNSGLIKESTAQIEARGSDIWNWQKRAGCFLNMNISKHWNSKRSHLLSLL